MTQHSNWLQGFVIIWWGLRWLASGPVRRKYLHNRMAYGFGLSFYAKFPQEGSITLARLVRDCRRIRAIQQTGRTL